MSSTVKSPLSHEGKRFDCGCRWARLRQSREHGFSRVAKKNQKPKSQGTRLALVRKRNSRLPQFSLKSVNRAIHSRDNSRKSPLISPNRKGPETVVLFFR